jgi:methionyl aminopeptidase
MLDYACTLAVAGATTDDIDRLTHEAIVKAGAYPSPLRYATFPKSICTSVNEIVCHGIPDDRPLALGDMLKIDVSLFFNGLHGDNCATVMVGGDSSTRPEDRVLIDATRDALNKAIEICGPGV